MRTFSLSFIGTVTTFTHSVSVWWLTVNHPFDMKSHSHRNIHFMDCDDRRLMVQLLNPMNRYTPCTETSADKLKLRSAVAFGEKAKSNYKIMNCEHWTFTSIAQTTIIRWVFGLWCQKNQALTHEMACKYWHYTLNVIALLVIITETFCIMVH